MAVSPNSLVTPQGVTTSVAVCTAAKTDYTNTTNAVRLIQASQVPNGGLVKRLIAIPRGSCSPTQLQSYRSYNSGSVIFLADSSQLPAYTVASGTAVTKGDFGYTADNPMRIAPGEEVWVGIGAALANGIVFIAEVEAF